MGNQPTQSVIDNLMKDAQKFESWIVKLPMFEEADNQEDIILSINELMTAIHTKKAFLIREVTTNIMHEMPFDTDDGYDEWHDFYDSMTEYYEKYSDTTSHVYGIHKNGQDENFDSADMKAFAIIMIDSDNDIIGEVSAGIADQQSILCNEQFTINKKNKETFPLFNKIAPFSNQVGREILKSIELAVNDRELIAGNITSTAGQKYTWMLVQKKMNVELTPFEAGFRKNLGFPTKAELLQNSDIGYPLNLRYAPGNEPKRNFSIIFTNDDDEVMVDLKSFLGEQLKIERSDDLTNKFNITLPEKLAINSSIEQAISDNGITGTCITINGNEYDLNWMLVQSVPDSELTPRELEFSKKLDLQLKEDYLESLEYPAQGMRP